MTVPTADFVGATGAGVVTGAGDSVGTTTTLVVTGITVVVFDPYGQLVTSAAQEEMV